MMLGLRESSTVPEDVLDKRRSVLLLGYFGRGNLGDDVLMVVTHNIIKGILPDADISVRTACQTDYIDHLVGSPVRQIPFGTRGHYSVIVHGGGGNFFDFQARKGYPAYLARLALLPGVGPFLWLDKMARRLTGRPRLNGDRRIGLGIGVGSYAKGSSRLLDELPVLADFDALWVRDPASVGNVERLGVMPPLVRGSDLAFMWEAWCPPELALAHPPSAKARPSVGLILRDWRQAGGESLAQQSRDLLSQLEQRYDVELLSFEPSADAGTLAELAHLPSFEWDPNVHTLADAARALSRQSLLITARAHGAICGSCVGRPSVIIEVEPKLRAVHEMLPLSSSIARMDDDVGLLLAKVEKALQIPHSVIADEVARNRLLSIDALEQVLHLAGLPAPRLAGKD